MTEYEETDDIIPEYITLREALEFVAYGIRPLNIHILDEKKYIPYDQESTQNDRAKLINAIKSDEIRIRGVFGTIKMVLADDLADDYMQLKVDFEKQGIQLSKQELEQLANSEKNKIIRPCFYDVIDGREYHPGMREEKIFLPLVSVCGEQVIDSEIEIRRKDITPKDLSAYNRYMWEYNLIVQQNVYEGNTKGDYWESDGVAFVEVYYPSLIKFMRNTTKKLKTNEKQNIILNYAKKIPLCITNLNQAVDEISEMLSEDIRNERGFSKSSIRRVIENMTKNDDSSRFEIDKKRGRSPIKN